MSDSQAYEAITVASDGVTVTKRFEADEFPVPAIAFNVVSQRSEPVNLRLVDTVPDDVAVEDLGFHPEYGSEFWDINDDRITFEKELEADSEYTTVYGIRATGTDDVEKFLTEPTIENVAPPLGEDETALVGGNNDAVKDVIAGESDSVPGLEDEDDEDIETLNLKDPNNERTESGADAEDADGEDESQTATGNVVAAMANEIRQNNVAAEDVKLLKRALDAVSEDSGPEDGVNTARINRIQNDIADLRAYTDALEAFLAENGTGDEIIEEFDERLDTFESELDSFEDEIRSAKSAAEAATEEIDSLDSEVDSLEDGLDDVESELDDLEGEIESVRAEIGDGELADRVAELEEEIIQLNEWREQLSSVIGGGSS